MSMQGMNLTAMRGVAKALTDCSQDLDDAVTRLDQLLRRVDWRGADAEQFLQSWRTKDRPFAVRGITYLSERGTFLQNQITEQETSSNSDGQGATGGSGGGAPTTPPGTSTTSSGYSIGPAHKPDIHWDEDFVWGSQSATPQDVASAAEWRAKGELALLAPGLGDAARAYLHYWDNNGEPFPIDYERAAAEDSSIQQNIDDEIRRSMAGAEDLINQGNQSFSMTGPASGSQHYPVTENWQKTIGGYQQWSSAEVTTSGNTATMTITVHAEDYYNFNKGQADIASGTPDNVNGRFCEIGWAKPFPTSGEVTRVVTWELGSNNPTISTPSGTHQER
ncbi:MAG TPA: hypothetical protein PKD84_01755 [Propionicimonas sp.]|nr:hypothetical protein [Propionicimonas sp.]